MSLPHFPPGAMSPARGRLGLPIVSSPLTGLTVSLPGLHSSGIFPVKDFRRQLLFLINSKMINYSTVSWLSLFLLSLIAPPKARGLFLQGRFAL